MSETPTYPAPVDLFHLFSGEEPDTHWKAFLRVATASDTVWRIFSLWIDLERQEVNLEELQAQLGYLSSGEALMVELVLNLYNAQGNVDMAALASTLDTVHWEVALEALHIYRQGFFGR